MRRASSRLLGLALLAASCTSSWAADPRSVSVEWRTLARSASKGDSIEVRASWLRSDPEIGESTYVAYVIEESGRGSVFADTLIRPGDGDWCGHLDVTAVPWRAGHWVRVVAVCWPCYGECWTARYVYIEGGKAAVSESEQVTWDAERGASPERWVSDHGIKWRLPLRAVLEGATLRFVEDPPTVAPSAPFRVKCESLTSVSQNEQVSVTLFESPNAPAGKRVQVAPTDSRSVMGAVAMKGRTQDTTGVQLFRVEVRIGTRHGWVSPDDVVTLGWAEVE